MAKKKTDIEQAASDVRKGQKMVRDAITCLEKKISYLERQLKRKDEDLEQEKAEHETLIQELFGNNKDNYINGYKFERFIVRWMDINFSTYKLKIWQGDKCIKIFNGTKTLSASWNQYPDLIFVNESEKKVVALECKYKYDGWLKLDKRQYNNYTNFETQIRSLMGVDAKVYIMGGSRGLTPDYPDYVYCIPIDYFRNKDIVDFRDIPEYKVYERGVSNVIKENIPFKKYGKR